MHAWSRPEARENASNQATVGSEIFIPLDGREGEFSWPIKELE